MNSQEFKQIRNDLGLSLRQMAEKLYLKDERMIRRYEDGSYIVPERVIKRMQELINQGG